MNLASKQDQAFPTRSNLHVQAGRKGNQLFPLQISLMLTNINKLGNWLLSQDGADQYKERIMELRQKWVEAETLLESAAHWSDKVGAGDMYELNDGSPPFKAAFDKIAEVSNEWTQLISEMEIPYSADTFPAVE